MNRHMLLGLMILCLTLLISNMGATAQPANSDSVMVVVPGMSEHGDENPNPAYSGPVPAQINFRTW